MNLRSVYGRFVPLRLFHFVNILNFEVLNQIEFQLKIGNCIILRVFILEVAAILASLCTELTQVQEFANTGSRI